MKNMLQNFGSILSICNLAEFRNCLEE